MTRDDWDRLFDELYLRTYAQLERGDDPGAEVLGFVRLAGRILSKEKSTMKPLRRSGCL